MRIGAWVYLLIPVVLFGQVHISLNIALLAWAIFVVIGASMIFYKLRSFYKIENFLVVPSFGEYKNQISLSTPFFLSGLFLLSIEILGRISLQIVDFQIEAGVYTFYAGFVFAIPLFVWSASISIDHPKILTAFENNNLKESDRLVLIMIKRSLIICLSLVLLLFFGFEILLEIINKDVYLSYINSFFLFLLVPFVHVIDSHIYYMLYVRGMDKEIALSSVIGLLSLIVFQIFTLSKLGMVSVVLSIIIALIFSICIKLLFIYKNKATQCLV